MNRRSILIGGGTALALAGGGALAWTRSTGSMSSYDTYAGGLRAPLADRSDLTELVRYATLAASGHNTQPWRFAATDASIRITPDMSRRTAVVDPDDHHLYASLGCAAENLAVASRATGRPGEMDIAPDGSTIDWRFAAGPDATDPLFDAIPVRQSTRGDYDGRAIPAEDLDALARIAAEPGVELVLITERSRIDQVGELILAGNDAQMADPAFVAELKRWIRFNPRSAMASGDGLLSAASGNPPLPSWLGDAAFSSFVTAQGERERYARQIASSPALAIFVGAAADPLHWIKVGQACQRFALAATVRGLKHAFLNQPVEVAGLRPELAALIGLPGRRPDIVMRLGAGGALPFSPRRPVREVMA